MGERISKQQLPSLTQVPIEFLSDSDNKILCDKYEIKLNQPNTTSQFITSIFPIGWKVFYNKNDLHFIMYVDQFDKIKIMLDTDKYGNKKIWFLGDEYSNLFTSKYLNDVNFLQIFIDYEHLDEQFIDSYNKESTSQALLASGHVDMTYIDELGNTTEMNLITKESTFEKNNN